MTRPGNKRLLASQRSNGANFIDKQSRFNNSIYNDIKKKEVIGDSKLVVGSGKNEKITIQTDGNDYTLTLNGDATLPVVGGGNVNGLTVNSQTHDIAIANNNTIAGDGTTNTLGDRTVSLGGNLTTVGNDITIDTGSAARTVRLGGDLTTVGSNVTIDGSTHGNAHAKFIMNNDLTINGIKDLVLKTDGRGTVRTVEINSNVKLGGGLGAFGDGDIEISSNNATARRLLLGGDISISHSALGLANNAGARNIVLGGDLTVENNNFAIDSAYGNSEIFMGADMLTIGDGNAKTGDITIASTDTAARSITMGADLKVGGSNKGKITITSGDANPRELIFRSDFQTGGSGAGLVTISSNNANGRDIVLGGHLTTGGTLTTDGDVKIDGRPFVITTDAEYNGLGFLRLTVCPPGTTAGDLGFANGQAVSINPAPGLAAATLEITVTGTNATVDISSIIGTVYSGVANVILGTGLNQNQIMINITTAVGGGSAGILAQNIVVTGGLYRIVVRDAPGDYTAKTHNTTGFTGAGANNVNNALDELSTKIEAITTALRAGNGNKILIS